jgi:outer membrane protein assembly factor BamB
MISPEPAWAFRLEKERNVFARRASLMGGTAYVAFSYDKRGFFESKLFARDLETGSEKWSYTVEHVGNEPVADAGGTIYWSSFEGNVHALDVHGSLLWKAPGTKSNIGVPRLLGDDRLAVPEIAGGARATWCLDRATGKTLWRFEHGGHTYNIHCHGERVLNSSTHGRTDGATLSCLAGVLAGPGQAARPGAAENRELRAARGPVLYRRHAVLLV